MCGCSRLSINTDIHKDTVMLLALFKRLFSPITYSSELESYIVSKNPQNAADVEHFERQFNYKITQGKFI